MDYSNSADVMGMLAPIFGTICLIGFVWYVLLVVAYWKTFTKMGEPGWKSIIPFYNDYVMTVRTWKALPFWITFIGGIITGILSSIMSRLGTTPLYTVLTLVSLVVMIVIFVFTVRKMNHISKAFGQGTGFTVGLVLLTPIFMMILGFGSAQYNGPVE